MNPVETKNLAVTITDRLAHMIQTGVLKPGERLIQLDLSNRLGVSRAAVRDALHLLCQRGLSVTLPRGGTIVRPVSLKEVHDIFAVRRPLESLAAREACANLTEADLDKMAAIITEQEALAAIPDANGLLEKDREFHDLIFSNCPNDTLRNIITTLWSRTHQARSLAHIDTTWAQSWGKKSAVRHRKILAALRKRDPRRVDKCITETIDHAEEELIIGLMQTDWGKQ